MNRGFTVTVCYAASFFFHLYIVHYYCLVMEPRGSTLLRSKKVEYQTQTSIQVTTDFLQNSLPPLQCFKWLLQQKAVLILVYSFHSVIIVSFLILLTV
jgi:hypothetical protein